MQTFSFNRVIQCFLSYFIINVVLLNERLLILFHQRGWDSGHNNLHVQRVDHRNLRENRMKERREIKEQEVKQTAEKKLFMYPTVSFVDSFKCFF